MAEQTFNLPDALYDDLGPKSWFFRDNRPQIDTALTAGATRYLRGILFSFTPTTRYVQLYIANASSGLDVTRDDLSDDFELYGSVEITFDGTTYTFALDAKDRGETYSWLPSNEDDLEDLWDALGSATTHDATLVLRVPDPVAVEISKSLGSLSASVEASVETSRFEQAFQFAVADFLEAGTGRYWSPPSKSRVPTALDSRFHDSSDTYYLATIGFFEDGSLGLYISDSVSSNGLSGGQDLAGFEPDGSIKVEIGSDTWYFALEGADTTEPYVFTPSNSDDVAAVRAALGTGGAAGTATLANYDQTPMPEIFANLGITEMVARLGDEEVHVFLGDTQLA